MKAYLHIHHLDPGEEEKKVISLLEKDGLLNSYAIEGNTESGNSIRIFIDDFKHENIENKIFEVLSLISTETAGLLYEMELSINLRLVVTGGLSAFFSQKILALASSKGIGIYVFNQQNV